MVSSSFNIIPAFVALTLTIFSYPVNAQPAVQTQTIHPDTFSNRVAKSWRLEYMVIEDDTTWATADEQKDKIRYKADKTLVIKERDREYTGTWSYNALTGELTIGDDETGDAYTMSVIAITDSTFHVRYNDIEHGTYAVHLVPSTD
jgi:hypothetical protein